MFLESVSVLALHQKHYGKTDVSELVIHKKRSEKMNVEYQLNNEVGEMKITFARDLEEKTAEIAKERRRLTGYPPTVRSEDQT